MCVSIKPRCTCNVQHLPIRCMICVLGEQNRKTTKTFFTSTQMRQDEMVEYSQNIVINGQYFGRKLQLKKCVVSGNSHIVFRHFISSPCRMKKLFFFLLVWISCI